jgi:hypothetical protein
VWCGVVWCGVVWCAATGCLDPQLSEENATGGVLTDSLLTLLEKRRGREDIFEVYDALNHTLIAGGWVQRSLLTSSNNIAKPEQRKMMPDV